MTSHAHVESKLIALRAAFDRGFAERPPELEHEPLDFLAIRVGSDSYVLSLSEVQSLHVGRPLVLAPSRVPALLGLAGFRGLLTPVYDLAQLLGYPAAPSAKWLVVARGPAPIAFAFVAFEAHLRVAPAELSAAVLAANSAVRGAVAHGGGLLPLLHLPSLIEDLAQRITTFGSSRER